jgi:hypothetical protein
MAYNIITLRGALKEMDVASADKPWIWQANDKAVNPKLQEQFPYGRAKADYDVNTINKKDPDNINKILNDLTEYCWLVYSKSFETSGPHIIGRVDDLWIPAYLELFGITDKKTQTLWNSSAKGNIQVMDKWSPVVNDCWVLGGVHRRASFQLVSVLSPKNLWDLDRKGHVVTAREILGLLHFGYSMMQGPASLWFTCTDVAKANAATVQEYSSFMRAQEAMGPDSIKSLLVADAALRLDPTMKREIEAFEKAEKTRLPASRP